MNPKGCLILTSYRGMHYPFSVWTIFTIPLGCEILEKGLRAFQFSLNPHSSRQKLKIFWLTKFSCLNGTQKKYKKCFISHLYINVEESKDDKWHARKVYIIFCKTTVCWYKLGLDTNALIVWMNIISKTMTGTSPWSVVDSHRYDGWKGGGEW